MYSVSLFMLVVWLSTWIIQYDGVIYHLELVDVCSKDGMSLPRSMCERIR